MNNVKSYLWLLVAVTSGILAIVVIFLGLYFVKKTIYSAPDWFLYFTSSVFLFIAARDLSRWARKKLDWLEAEEFKQLNSSWASQPITRWPGYQLNPLSEASTTPEIRAFSQQNRKDSE